MVHLLLLRIKNVIKKIADNVFFKKIAAIIGATIVVNASLTLFGFKLNLWTLFGSLGLYFVYEEIMGDLKSIARFFRR